MGLGSAIAGFIGRLFAGRLRGSRDRFREFTATSQYRSIKAKYDAAIDGYGDGNYWSKIDSLSSRDENSYEVRKRLREKSRYICANDAHGRGITLAIANDMIGTGPRLQVLFDDEGVCDAIESAWNEWADEINLGQKLHTFHLASEVDGEAFLLLRNNPGLMSSVQLDVVPRECDMVTTPYGMTVNPDRAVDGIEFDEFGNITYYHLLKNHPGSFTYAGFPQQADRVPSRYLLHWFRHDRLMQFRGIPSLTPALSKLAQLGRYSSAVLAAAEIAASYAAFIYTDQRPGDELTDAEMEELKVKPWSTTSLSAGTMQALPDAWKVEQLKPTQPITSYGDYCKALLREICHALLIPYNIANADFEGDSYAGGRMSLQVYQRQIKVRRSHFKTRIMDRIFAAWLDEAVRVPKLLPAGIPANYKAIPHAWYFDAWGHVDPTKEAAAVTTRLSNFTTTLAGECAENGMDWRKVIKQRAIEIEMQKALGVLILPPGTPPLDEQGSGSTDSGSGQSDAIEEAT